MNQCVVNIQGYVRLTGFVNQQDVILPYICKDDKGVFVVNPRGNAIYVLSEQVDILW